MTNNETWECNYNFYAETEAGLEMENWMTSPKTWNIKETMVEPELTVENWMIDSTIWEEVMIARK